MSERSTQRRSKAGMVFTLLCILCLLGCTVLGILLLLTHQRIDAADASLSDTKAQITQVQSDLRALEDECDDLEDDIDACREAVDALREASSAMRAELTQAQDTSYILKTYTVVAAQGSRTYHVYGCKALEGKAITFIANEELARYLGMRACKECH